MAENDLKSLLDPNSDGELAGVVRRAHQMGELTHVLCAGLPAEYAGAIAAANVREDGSLVVIAASSAWASRLRFESEKLMSAARETGLDTTSCRIRVASN